MTHPQDAPVPCQPPHVGSSPLNTGFSILIPSHKPKLLHLAQCVVSGFPNSQILIDPTDTITSPIAVVGVRPISAPFLHHAHQERRLFMVVDNGFFSTTEAPHYRIAINALQYHQAPSPSGIRQGKERFERFGRKVRPWRQSGSHILITQQWTGWYQMFGLERDQWTEQLISSIRKVSDRPIRIRRKPMVDGAGALPPIEEDLKDAWCVVGLSSNTLVDALIAGIPVFPQGHCAASCMGLRDLSRIEFPYLPDQREEWLWNLAAQQWTDKQIADGTAIGELEGFIAAEGLPLHTECLL